MAEWFKPVNIWDVLVSRAINRCLSEAKPGCIEEHAGIRICKVDCLIDYLNEESKKHYMTIKKPVAKIALDMCLQDPECVIERGGRRVCSMACFPKYLRKALEKIQEEASLPEIKFEKPGEIKLAPGIETEVIMPKRREKLEVPLVEPVFKKPEEIKLAPGIKTEVKLPRPSIVETAKALGIPPAKVKEAKDWCPQVLAKPVECSEDAIAERIFCIVWDLVSNKGYDVENAEREAVDQVGRLCGTSTVMETIIKRRKM